MKEHDQQMPRSRRNEVCDETRPKKVRRIDEACADGPKSYGQTGSRNEGHARSTFTHKLYKRIEAQSSNKVTMHDIKNSKSKTAKATMRHRTVITGWEVNNVLCRAAHQVAKWGGIASRMRRSADCSTLSPTET